MGCQFKGQGFLGVLVALAQLKGPEAKRALLPKLNPDLRLLIERDAILASGWYPMAWYSELTTAIRTEYGPSISLELGRLGMRNDVNTFARFILGLASPVMLLKLSGRLMKLYFIGAILQVEQTGPQEGRLRFSGIDGSSEASWAAIAGAVAAFVELSGGKEVRTNVASGGGLLDHCELVVTWLA